MKYITTQDGNTYRRVSRWIRCDYIQVTRRHSLYEYSDGETLLCFRHGGRLYAMSQFMRLTYPELYNDENGKTGHLSGYDSTQWYNPLLIEIHENGDYIRLFQEVTA